MNHNRYAYKTEEECPPTVHTVPWGNWGVSSNVGRKRDTDQFKGWRDDCGIVKVQWNSCSVNVLYRLPNYLNFPAATAAFPIPANGYPFSDSYAWNDQTPPYGLSYQVDQYSPCGPGIYGGLVLRQAVPPLVDTNADGVGDSGGCLALNGKIITIQQNFMSVYELDTLDEDDLIQTMFYPDLTVRLSCTPARCYATADQNQDGFADPLPDPGSDLWKWPVLYEDARRAVCNPDTQGVPCKKIDATIAAGYISGVYSGPLLSERERPDAPPVALPRRGSLRGGALAGVISALPLQLFPVFHASVAPDRRTLTGVVVDAVTDAPIAADIGMVQQTEDGLAVRYVRSLETGGFSVDDLPAGALHLSSAREGYATEHVSIVPGQTPYVELRMLRARAVRGQVVNTDGAPVRDALVRALHRAETSLTEPLHAAWQWETGELRTDSEGRFVIDAHPAREFMIEALPGRDFGERRQEQKPGPGEIHVILSGEKTPARSRIR
ncbi:MAG: carboxypeptidase-like regulatory domain-containing protein [Blastocatellia bacterium]